MSEQEEYISNTRSAGIVGCGRETFRKVAERARIRVRQIPGLPARYHRGDVEALAASSLRVAGTEGEASSTKSTSHTLTAV